jgi:hypothetical protein
VLKAPKMDGDNLTFDVQALEGSLAGANGPASVFIDIIGLPFTPLSFAGVARRSARRAAWYGGAAAAAYVTHTGTLLSPTMRLLPRPALLLTRTEEPDASLDMRGRRSFRITITREKS